MYTIKDVRSSLSLGFFAGLAVALTLVFLFQSTVCHAQGREPNDPRILVHTGSYTGTVNGPWTGASYGFHSGSGIAIGPGTGDPTDDGTIGRYFDFKALQLQRAREAAEYALARVHFAFDSSAVEEEYEILLDELAQLLLANPEIYLRLEGHTDLVGSNEYNDVLGTRRANAIQVALVQRGVPDGRLTALSRGESFPLRSIQTRERLNRRVESGAVIRIPAPMEQ